jgi:hypothetical protein
MPSPRIVYALIGFNLLLVGILVSRVSPLLAHPVPSPILRGQGLEIVDDQGKIRASITLIPPSRTDGRNYPETILLRLIDGEGKPVVKIGASDDGSGMTLMNERDEGIQMLAQDTVSQVKVTGRNGRAQVLRP